MLLVRLLVNGLSAEFWGSLELQILNCVGYGWGGHCSVPLTPCYSRVHCISTSSLGYWFRV